MLHEELEQLIRSAEHGEAGSRDRLFTVLYQPRLAQIVDLKFFCGFSFAEIAELLGVSERTAQRDWDKARILLRHHLDHTTAPPGGAEPEV